MYPDVLLNFLLRDGGQAYTETNLSRLIVEPWNFVTAAFFVILSVYWLLKVGKTARQHLFLYVMLWLLLVGSIGGTLYHGFRFHRLFLLMDWMPILLITFASSVWFFIRAWGRWGPPLLLVAAFFVFQAALFRSGVPIQVAINSSYASMAVLVLFPVGWFLRKSSWQNGLLVLLALAAFAAALFFRWADHLMWLPVGTHFLWHLFGLLAVHLMLRFVWLSYGKQP